MLYSRLSFHGLYIYWLACRYFDHTFAAGRNHFNGFMLLGQEMKTSQPQCEAYELAKLGHEYEDLSEYQNPEYEIPVTEGPAHVPTRKSGE